MSRRKTEEQEQPVQHDGFVVDETEFFGLEESAQIDDSDPAALEDALDANISGKNFLTPEEENTLVVAYQNNSDPRAFEKLWQNHQGIIRNIAIKENRRAAHIDFDDLMQEAAMGFMTAIKKFDPERGFRLMTYAQWRVREEVRRYVQDNRTVQKTTVDFPPKYRDATARYYNLQQDFEKVGREWPPKDSSVKREFVEETGIDFHELEYFLSAYYNQAVSLDTPVDPAQENGISLLDGMVDTDMPATFDSMARTAEQNAVDQAMRRLSEQERDILRRRYGIDTGEPETLEQIAPDHGVSCERIRQIQVRAEERFKQAFVNRSRDIANDYKPK